MKTAIKLVLIYFVMQILAALLVMPFAMLYSYAVKWYDRCCKRYSFGSEYVAGICRYGLLFVEEGLFER